MFWVAKAVPLRISKDTLECASKIATSGCILGKQGRFMGRSRRYYVGLGLWTVGADVALTFSVNTTIIVKGWKYAKSSKSKTYPSWCWGKTWIQYDVNTTKTLRQGSTFGLGNAFFLTRIGFVHGITSCSSVSSGFSSTKPFSVSTSSRGWAQDDWWTAPHHTAELGRMHDKTSARFYLSRIERTAKVAKCVESWYSIVIAVDIKKKKFKYMYSN